MVSNAVGGRRVKADRAALAAIMESGFKPDPGTSEDDARLAEQDAVLLLLTSVTWPGAEVVK